MSNDFYILGCSTEEQIGVQDTIFKLEAVWPSARNLFVSAPTLS
jgi:hypothetical protein